MRIAGPRCWLRWYKSSKPPRVIQHDSSELSVLDSANYRVPFGSLWAITVFAFPNNENELKC